MTVRPAFSLLELIVVIAILGIVTTLVATAWVPSRPMHPDLAASLRRDAVGQAVTVAGHDSSYGRSLPIAAYPDGRVVVDSTGEQP